MRVLTLLFLLCCIATAAGIRCYVCNSLMNPQCEHEFDKVPNLQMNCMPKMFSGKKSVKAIGCRISRQVVQDEKSVVRECAYSGTNVENKSQKGSLGVARYITQCDTDLCNSTGHLSLLSCLIALLLFRL